MTCDGTTEILLVDDYPENTALLQAALSEYKTTSVDNGPDALCYALECKPALILLDINMPGMNGLEVCRILKESDKTRNIPIIFLTGMADPNDIAKGFELGAVDYVTKPFNFQEIKSRIATHLSLYRSQRVLEKQNEILLRIVKEQQIDAALARKILAQINGSLPRYIDLDEDSALFFMNISQPCKLAGGDHCLVRTTDLPTGGRKTILSLKDQSGHSVNCMLRSIVTDFFHNKLMDEHPDYGVDTVFSRLNHLISKSDFFAGDAFCTGFTAELFHDNLQFNYVSAGHPPMMLIRRGVVSFLPDADSGQGNLPLAVMPEVKFEAGSLKLQLGDKLIIYTDGLNALVAGKPLRQQELLDLVSDVVAKGVELPVSGIVRELFDRMGALGADGNLAGSKLTDDLSVLALEVENSGSYSVKKFYPKDYENIDYMVKDVFDTLTLPIHHDCAKLVISEAILNAWRHGNGEDPAKAVGVRVWQGNDWNIEISDQGLGFDPDIIPDPTKAENLQRATGRGIFVIRSCCDWLRWQDNGRRAVISIHT